MIEEHLGRNVIRLATDMVPQIFAGCLAQLRETVIADDRVNAPGHHQTDVKIDRSHWPTACVFARQIDEVVQFALAGHIVVGNRQFQ